MGKLLGIDVGSTTVKLCLLDEDGKIAYSSYVRHFSRVKECVLSELGKVHKFADKFRVSVTGSAGLGLAERANIGFVQEVQAAYTAIRKLYPDADAAVELGGEDAKIIFLTGGTEQRMNGSCAGGTGAFIDQMATLLDMSVSDMDALSLAAERVYPIASRCGVFAKSDIQPLLNQGAKKADIAASIFRAVVDQTVSGLAQGRRIKGKVLFLGGPLYFLKGLWGWTTSMPFSPRPRPVSWRSGQPCPRSGRRKSLSTTLFRASKASRIRATSPLGGRSFPRGRSTRRSSAVT